MVVLTRRLTFDDVSELLSKALTGAMSHGVAVAIAVVDAQGGLLGFRAMEFAIPASTEMSIAKAWTAAAFQRDNGDLRDITLPSSECFGMSNVFPGRFVTTGGGVALWHEGVCIGAIGISGGSTEQDVVIARVRISDLDVIGQVSVTSSRQNLIKEITVEELVGIDAEAVSAWITSEVPDVQAPLTFELIAGGRSNLTYRMVDAQKKQFALRRPPVGHLLPTAHDMQREVTVISALAETSVPVPQVYGLCMDNSVNGAPFYVMSFVQGHILRDRDSARGFGLTERMHASHSMVDTLAGLHAVDIDASGLGNLAKRDDYVPRQLRRWHRQYTDSVLSGVSGTPTIGQAYDILRQSIPKQQRSSVVHGDFRLDNTVLDGEGQVLAVLDWEICTLGDPLADLGLLLVYWAEEGEDAAVLSSLPPTTLPGFASRDQMIERYARKSGLDVSNVPYYRALGFWKLACILQGVATRYATGSAAGDRSGAEEFAGHVVRMGERAFQAAQSI